MFDIEKDNTYKFMFNNAQIVLNSMSAEQLEQPRQKQKVKHKLCLKSMSVEQLEQLRQKQKVKPKDAAETPKQRAIVP